MSAQANGLGTGAQNERKPQPGRQDRRNHAVTTRQFLAAPVGAFIGFFIENPGRWPGLTSGCHVVAEEIQELKSRTQPDAPDDRCYN